MTFNKLSPKRLLIVIILGAFSPCICSWLYGLRPESFAELFTSIDAHQLEILVVAVVVLLPDVWTSIASIRNPVREITISPRDVLIQGAIRSLSIILLMLYIGIHQPTGLASIGLQPHTNLFDIAVMSALVYSFFLIPLVLYRLIRRTKKKVDDSRPDVKVFLAYRTSRQRFACLVVLLFDVIAEDLVYRGYLVLLLSARTSTPFLWAVISVALSAVNHLYQGRSMILYHVIGATVFVSVSIVTGNIFLAIGTHLLNNLAFTVGVWDWADKQASQVTEATTPTRDVA